MKKESRNNFIQKINFRKHIKESCAGFSGKQLKIADYIIRDNDEATFLTAAQLASKVQVSKFTVVRFAATLGYEGYPEFQGHLRKIIMEQLTSTERLKLSIHSETKDNLFRWTLLKEADNIIGAYRNISTDDFWKMIDIILRSKKVFVAGLRASTCLTQFIVFQLRKIRENVIGITHGGKDSWDIIRRGVPEDLLIAIAFPRYTREMVELIDFTHHMKIQVAGITDSVTSPIAVRCRPTLFVPFELLTYVNLYSATFAVIAALIAEIAIRDKKKTHLRLNEFEDFVKQGDLYYKVS
jgi:DNA-binding MurR/RpiR family transcriptional regulator